MLCAKQAGPTHSGAVPPPQQPWPGRLPAEGWAAAASLHDRCCCCSPAASVLPAIAAAAAGWHWVAVQATGNADGCCCPRTLASR